MALVYTGPHDHPDGVLAAKNWAYGIDEEGPIVQLFEKLSGLNVIFQPGLKGVTPWADGVHMRVAVIEDGDFIWIAGRKGGFGSKDGPAADATFSIGFIGYTAYSTVIDSHGDIYIAEGYNGKIRKISKDPTQTWHQAKAAGSIMVSTFASVGGIGMTIDANDNIWTAPGEGITKIAPDGTKTNYGYTSDTDLLNGGNYNIDTLASDKAGQIFARSNWNWASVFWQIDTTNGSLKRIAGMSEQMIAAYLVANGFPATGDDQYNNHAPTPVDGPNLTATFHTANLVGMDYGPDGKAIFLLTGNGDEPMVRKIDLITGRTSHLMGDGTWQELTDRYGSTLTVIPTGFDPVTKAIYTMQQSWLWIPPTLWRRMWQLTLDTVPDPTPDPGGNMDQWQPIAAEGQTGVAATGTVRYGAQNSWVQKDVTGTFDCTNAFFGTDPIPNVVKSCQLLVPATTETRSVKIDWTTQDQMRTDFANFGKFRLSVGSLTPVMISDLTLRTYTMADIPVGTYNVELALVSLDGATVAGTITGVLTVTSAVTPPPPPPPEQGVPVPATLAFTLL